MEEKRSNLVPPGTRLLEFTRFSTNRLEEILKVSDEVAALVIQKAAETSKDFDKNKIGNDIMKEVSSRLKLTEGKLALGFSIAKWYKRMVLEFAKTKSSIMEARIMKAPEHKDRFAIIFNICSDGRLQSLDPIWI